VDISVKDDVTFLHESKGKAGGALIFLYLHLLSYGGHTFLIKGVWQLARHRGSIKAKSEPLVKLFLIISVNRAGGAGFAQAPR
jgi:hypothetical protein